MAHIQKHRFRQAVHQIGLTVVIETGAKQAQIRLARPAAFLRKHTVGRYLHPRARIGASRITTQNMADFVRKKHHVAAAQQARFVHAVHLKPTLAVRYDVHQGLTAPRLMPHIPSALKQALYVHTAADLRQRHQLVENIHFYATK